MTVDRRLALAAVGSGILATLTGTSSAAAATTDESTWEHIKRTGTLRHGVINYPPNWTKDKVTGKWSGALYEMAEDAAKEIGVKAVPVETTWATAILDIQSAKIDIALGFQATPQRATAVSFAGPNWYNAWCVVTPNKILTRNWSEIDRPDVRIAVITGSVDGVVLRNNAPRATVVDLPAFEDVVMAVISGHADGFSSSAMGSLVAVQRNPQLGDVVVPEPVIALPSYTVVRRESDLALLQYMQAWAEWNQILGYNEKRLKASLALMGVTKFPPTLKF
jgi:polar amino acid transport system substrate-binding protein